MQKSELFHISPQVIPFSSLNLLFLILVLLLLHGQRFYCEIIVRINAHFRCWKDLKIKNRKGKKHIQLIRLVRSFLTVLTMIDDNCNYMSPESPFPFHLSRYSMNKKKHPTKPVHILHLKLTNLHSLLGNILGTQFFIIHLRSSRRNGKITPTPHAQYAIMTF